MQDGARAEAPPALEPDRLGPHHQRGRARSVRVSTGRAFRRRGSPRRRRRCREEVRVADEVRDEAGGGLLVDLRRRAELLDPAVAHHGDAIGHRHRLLLVVRDVDERRPDVTVDLGQLDLEPLAELQVERAERLVEQQDRRTLDERPRDRDALLLAAGELRGHAVAERLEADEGERLLDALGRLGIRDPVHLQPEARRSRARSCAGRARSSGRRC